MDNISSSKKDLIGKLGLIPNNDLLEELKKFVTTEVIKLGVEESRAFISINIKEKFKLTDDETQILMDVLNEAEKKEKLYKKLLNIPNFITINPSMDYSEEQGMNYTFFGGDTKYIVTSKKEIYSFEECEENGIKLTNQEVSTSKLNPKIVVKYARDGMSVKASNIFLEIIEIFKKYIFLEIESLYSVLAMWIIHTYLYKLFLYVPYLWLNRRQRKSVNHWY